MPIDVTCPSCGRTLRAADRQAGKRCKCPGCAQLLTVPMPVGDASGGGAAGGTMAGTDVSDDLAALARAAAQARGRPRGRGPEYEDEGSRIENRAGDAPAPSSILHPPSSLEPPSAGLPSAGLPSAGLPSAGLPSAGVPSAGVPSAGVPSAGVRSAGLLGYADGGTPFRPQPVVGDTRPPLPVLAPPTQDVAAREKTWRGNGYWLLLVMMIPLGVLTFVPHVAVKERLERTMQHHPELPWGDSSLEEMTPQRLDDLLDQLPGHRLEGAFVSRTSVYPWLMALASAAAFIGIARIALPAPAVTSQRILLTGLFTGTLGVCVLLAIQFVGLFCCIGLFYLAALSPTAPFGPSLIGFVLGVGICEEIVKCMPILWLLWRGSVGGRLLTWRDACVIGLASGTGFGVSEGMLYSTRYYNGIEPATIYAVRFCSAVALHAALSAACALILQRKQDHLLGEKMDPINWLLTLAAIILVPIFLHGLFDAFAKQELVAGSLLVAVGSVLWLSWLIRHARAREKIELTAIAAGPRIVRTEKGTRYVTG